MLGTRRSWVLTNKIKLIILKSTVSNIRYRAFNLLISYLTNCDVFYTESVAMIENESQLIRMKIVLL